MNEITEKIEVARRLGYLSNCGNRLKRAADLMASSGVTPGYVDEAERCAIHALAHIKELREQEEQP